MVLISQALLRRVLRFVALKVNKVVMMCSLCVG